MDCRQHPYLRIAQWLHHPHCQDLFEQGGLALGRNHKFSSFIFPLRSVAVLETIANLGLLYFLFLVGIEMDIGIILRCGRKALSVALSSMLLPFLIYIVTTNVFFTDYLSKDGINQGSFLLFLGIALSITAFPVLARILVELKLLNTEHPCGNRGLIRIFGPNQHPFSNMLLPHSLLLSMIGFLLLPL